MTRTLFLALILFSPVAFAATYTFPGGALPSGCSRSLSVINCPGNVIFGNNDIVIVSSPTQWVIGGDFTFGNGLSINQNGSAALSITVTQNMNSGNNGIINANLIVLGNINNTNNSQITGGLSVSGNLVLGNNSVINGPIAVDGTLNTGENVTINGQISATNINIGQNNVITGNIETVNMNVNGSNTVIDGNINATGSVNLQGTVTGYINAPTINNSGATIQGPTCDLNQNVGGCNGGGSGAVEPAYFRITHSTGYGLCTAYTEINVSLVELINSVEVPIDDYTGTVTISNNGSLGAQGSYTAPGGNGNLTPVSPGVVTYQFDDLDDGHVTLRFVATGADTLTFDANDVLNGFSTQNYNLSMEVGDCTISITHGGLGGTCAITPVSFTVLAPGGVPAAGYTGDITVSTSPATGNWTNLLAAPGSFGNGTANDGIATYSFDGSENASVTLGFQVASPGNYTFSASATNGVGAVSFNDGILEMVADCEFRITLPSATGSVCSASSVLLSVTDTNGDVIAGFSGAVSLSTQGVTGGDWSKTGDPANAFGTLTPGPQNTGAAVYTFVPNDLGAIELSFANQNEESVNFNAFAPGVAQPSGIYDPDLNFEPCIFRVTHSSASDVCSIAEITVTLVDNNGAVVDDYEGQIILNTSTGFGEWVDIGESDGQLVDASSIDGAATYQFVTSDAGTITLGFRHATSTGPVNINVTDFVSYDAQNSADMYDQNLIISNCTFEISHAIASNACAVNDIEITVRNSTGGIAVDYNGTMRITNNTSRGDFLLSPGAQGVLDAPAGADQGLADYTFAPGPTLEGGDAGQVTLQFITQTTGTINFDIEDGVMFENGLFDPNLSLAGCFPTIVEGPVCTSPGTSAQIAVPAQSPNPALRGRLLLMATMQIGASANNTTATFDSQAMTRLRREYNPDDDGVTVELWAMLDGDLPALANTYQGQFNGGTPGSAICLMVVNGIEQNLPQAAAVPATGPLNSSQSSDPLVTINGDQFQEVQTTIRTNANNAFVISVAANNFIQSGNEGFFRPTQPAITFNDIWSAPQPGSAAGLLRENATNTAANPTGGRSAGSAGVQSALGIVEAREQFQYVPNIFTPPGSEPTIISQVVAAFNPLVPGDPQAEGYDPVILYKTYAGRMSYRAIGNSLRTQPSTSVQSTADCAFVPFETGTAATLNLPPGSTVTDAYLYWGGSGSVPAGLEDDRVTFGLTSGTQVEVVAQDVFSILEVTTEDLNFFAAYANVKDLITDNNASYTLRNLEVVINDPSGNYASNATCAGGWSLVVIYENPNERLRVVNLFHGFQPFQYSAFTLVPRNFRMARWDAAERLPNGQVTHFTLEGDEQLFTGDESLGIQDAPDSPTFVTLPNDFNPDGQEFNSTITRPIYSLQGNFYEFDEGQGQDGYEIDFPIPPAFVGPNRIGGTYGIDVDTHYLDNTLLKPFSDIVGQEAERITTRYSTGQDIVMLINEVISITNYPIADIEVFISDGGNLKVGETGSYFVEVRNNGNGTSTDGEATGEIQAAVRLPAGLTLANSGSVIAPGWSCNVATGVNSAVTCAYDLSLNPLLPGDSLPLIELQVDIGEPPANFQLPNNLVNVTARALQSGGSCSSVPPLAIGFLPVLDDCDRAPEFDNRFDLQGGAIDLNNLTIKTNENNNVHTVQSSIAGRFTNLRITKEVVDLLQAGQSAQYALTVTNLGPDATSTPFTVEDTLPVALDFNSATGNGPDAADWACSFNSPEVSCTYTGTLALNASTTLILDVDVVGAAGINVVNTAEVTAGQYNFDSVTTNNVATDVTTIVGQPTAGQERFLLSVSDLSNSTSIANLSDFQNHDLIIYDPSTNEAEMFFDNSALGFSVNDINAAHLLKNGHIILSANQSSTIGTNNLAFDPWDLVKYDPILGTASLFLDGSTVFDDYENVDINAVYIVDDCDASIGNSDHENCTIILSTTDDVVAGINNQSFTASDLFSYTRSSEMTAIYVDGSNDEVFGATEGAGNVNVDAFYVRTDPADSNGLVERYAYSVDNENALLGVGLSPITGTPFTRDDVIELDLESLTQSTELLFDGSAEPGVFTATSAARRLDALHLVEDPYIGHFSITEVEGGSLCAPGTVRISKHEGLTHGVDADYYGSIRISTNSGVGTWQLDTGTGTLQNVGGPNDGQAIYTYSPQDQGRVTLRLLYDQIGTVNVNVTNGIAIEDPAEDQSLVFDEELTFITFIDEFEDQSFSNNDGSRNFSSSWTEIDAVSGVGTGIGADVGNILIDGGRLRLTSSVQAVNANIQPSLSRTLNLDPNDLPYTEDVELRIFYGHTTLAASDSLVLEARGASSDGWVEVNDFTGLTGNSANNAIEEVFNLSDILANASQSLTASTEIRLRINNGYELDRYFYVSRLVVQTATTECGYSDEGNLDHYAINHAGTGIQCIGTPITIIGHDGSNDPVEPGESIQLSVAGAKGVWSRVLAGSGALTPLASQTDNGVATYTFPPGESSVTLLLNYTEPANQLTPVNINVNGAVSGKTELEDPSLVVQSAGLVFYNETQSAPVIPTQIAGKPSTIDPVGDLLTLMAVRSTDPLINGGPLQCVPLFDDGQTLTIELAAECKDPSVCAGATLDAQDPEVFTVNSEEISLVTDNTAVGASAYTPVDLTFVTQPSGFPGATLELNYSDIGQVQLHARYDIPFGFFGDTNPVTNAPILADDPETAPTSGDFMMGSSNDFVVRPFAFAIDFNGDVGYDRTLNLPANNFDVGNSFAADSSGSAWQVAGDGFETVVAAVAWQAVDDLDQDGQPDTESNLNDNRRVASLFRDSFGNNNSYRVKLDVLENQAEADGGVPGSLSSDTLLRDDFLPPTVIGYGSLNTSYDEVGIIDIGAELIDQSGDPTTYLGTDVIVGHVRDVGRFYPARFEATNMLLFSRQPQSCSPVSEFTYMGEPFGIEVDLTARNRQGAVTQNYRSGFAKLTSFADLDFRAIEEVDSADNDDLTDRLVNASVPTALQGLWSAVTGGVLELSGNLIFNRADPAIPDGPYPDLYIALLPTDSDGVTVDDGDLDVELVLGDPTFVELARHEFRYGRLLIDNAYGPETEDLAITFRVEYFDGQRFILNIDDSCTTIESDELGLLPGTYTGDLASGETSIVSGESSTFYNAQIQGVEDDTAPEDQTFTATAPGEGNSGTVDVELDLDVLNLEFLQFRWPHEDNDYDENPRAQLEFGQFRSHDRVINWQEIYNGATP